MSSISSTHISENGISLNGVCNAGGASIVISSSSDFQGVADSYLGGHVTFGGYSNNTANLETLTLDDSVDRGSFDSFNINLHTLEGSWCVLFSGSGCQFEATASFS